MLEQNTSTTLSATSPTARRQPKLTDYNPLSHMVAPKHVPLVIGASLVSVWRWRRAGTFPQPIRLSVGRVAWRRSDLESWLAERQQVGR